MIPLPLVSAGSKVIVDSIRGNDNVRKQIMNLGILPGVEMELFSCVPNSPVVVKINENRIMIDSATSKRVMVRP